MASTTWYEIVKPVPSAVFSSPQSVSERIPARFVLVFMLFCGSFISYVIRSNLSLTLVAMVNQTALHPHGHNKSGNGSSDDGGQCPYTDESISNSSTSAFKDGPFLWDLKTQSFLQGGFFYGYTCTQLLAGRLSERLGAKHLISGGFTLAACLTLLIPVVSTWGPYYLLALRVLTGMSQGVLYPSTNTLFVRWIPLSERSRMFSIFNAGAGAGILISMPLIGWICELPFERSWQLVFYITGAAGVLFVVFWHLLSFSDPSLHPRISQEEKQFILSSLPEVKCRSVPWKAILTSPPVLAYFTAAAAQAWNYYTRLTELPTYLHSALHLPMEQNALVNTLVAVCAIVVGLASGFIADFMLKRDCLTRTKMRKFAEAIAQLGSSACLLAITFCGCDTVLVIALLALSSGVLAVSNAGVAVLVMDMAPSFSGTIYGIANTISASTGFLSPLLTGYLITRGNLLEGWHWVFYVTAGMGVLGSLAILLFGSAELQPWNFLDDQTQDDSEEEDRTAIIGPDTSIQ